MPQRGLPIVPLAMTMSVAVHGAAVVATFVPSRRASTVARAVPLDTILESVIAAPELPPDVPLPEEPVANQAPVPAVVHHAAQVHASPPPVSVAAPSPPSSPPPVAASAIDTDSPLPRFVIPSTTSAVAGPAIDGRAAKGAPALSDPSATEAPYAEAAVDIPARPLRKIQPTYPLQARSIGAEARVPLEIVLSRSGAVESVRALEHPGHGFEEEAVAAVRRTPFTPATKQGRAVPVRMLWSVKFELD